MVIQNNLFAGIPLKLSRGPAVLRANLTRRDHGMIGPDSYDFRLSGHAPAIDIGHPIKDTDAGLSFEYHHPRAGVPRPKLGPLDVGAHEWCGPNSQADLK